MLRIELVEEVRRRLAAGERHRAIARALKMNRKSVLRIARGLWRPAQARKKRGLHDRFPPEAFDPNGPPRRCEGCGATVRMPCLACRVRPLGPNTARDAAEEPNDIAIELVGGDHERYVRLKLRKLHKAAAALFEPDVDVEVEPSDEELRAIETTSSIPKSLNP